LQEEEEEIDANCGVMMKESVVEIAQESTACTKGEAALGGMDDLVKEICHFIGRDPCLFLLTCLIFPEY